jgi:hypothetical protein
MSHYLENTSGKAVMSLNYNAKWPFLFSILSSVRLHMYYHKTCSCLHCNQRAEQLEKELCCILKRTLLWYSWRLAVFPFPQCSLNFSSEVTGWWSHLFACALPEALWNMMTLVLLGLCPGCESDSPSLVNPNWSATACKGHQTCIAE